MQKIIKPSARPFTLQRGKIYRPGKDRSWSAQFSAKHRTLGRRCRDRRRRGRSGVHLRRLLPSGRRKPSTLAGGSQVINIRLQNIKKVSVLNPGFSLKILNPGSSTFRYLRFSTLNSSWLAVCIRLPEREEARRDHPWHRQTLIQPSKFRRLAARKGVAQHDPQPCNAAATLVAREKIHGRH